MSSSISRQAGPDSSFRLWADEGKQQVEYLENKMTEKHFILEEADPATFYGAANSNLRMLRALCPKLRIIGRDNVLKVMGDEEELARFEEIFAALQRKCVKFNLLEEKDILDIVKHPGQKEETAPGVIVYTTSGKPVTARSENQRRIVEAFRDNDMVFAIGPAGSGKTLS